MLPSLRMGRYVVEGLLGPGGVTETYLARLPEDAGGVAGQLFALKLLRRDRIPEGALAQVAARFVAAGRRLREFQRPGFGKVVDVSTDPSATFIVTEHVPGYDLARLLEMSLAEAEGRTGVDPDLAGLIGAEIARLLQVGHSARPSLPHLGLAPQNVLVTETGEVVLLDAGIAAAWRGYAEEAAERGWFVAPELRSAALGLAASNEREGVAADLYSLGALLYFLLAGQAPCRGAGAEPDGTCPTPPPELPGLSPKLNLALRSLLAPWPEQRPESAAALIERLSGGVDSVPKRQRLIALGLRKAEKEAREAAARGRESAGPAEIKVPLPADSLTAEALARAVPGLGRRRDRRRMRAAILFAALGTVAALVSLVLSVDWRFGIPGRERVGTREENGRSVVAGNAELGVGQSAPGAPTRKSILARLAGHLVVETVPPGATVWVDGVAKGTTFADILVGPGSHRVVLTLPGHHTFRDTVDTGPGAIIRRNLVPAPPLPRAHGFVRVECGTIGKYPILIDDEEVGLLCPSLRIPAAPGKHMVGIYLPAEKRVVSVAVTVEAGARPAMAKFNE
ncbi:MAG: PEGA domain-containing protein [Deltaproteobacteria bacterium]|nr:PEGA domain-containing protein [Deltaproteobacteria bacterium]